MAFSGWRARTDRLGFLLPLLVAGSGCARAPVHAPAREPPAFEAGVDLPAGAARDILIAACLSCHTLSALPLFKEFYTRDSWHALVLSMKGHGAEINDAEIELLADYLALHFGPTPTPAAGSP